MEDLRQELESIIERMDANDADIEDLIAYKSEIIGRIRDVEYDLRKAQEVILFLESDIEEYEACKDGSVPQPEGNIDVLRKQEEDYDNELDGLKAIKAEVDSYLSKYKVFDKTNLFANIRYYMSKSDIKIGQIEKAAGVRKGYMSRLDKPDSTTDPSMQFVATAARLLNVPIDELLFGHPTEMSEAEMYIYGFLRDLLDDTRTKAIIWSKRLESQKLREQYAMKLRDRIAQAALFENTEMEDGVDYGILSCLEHSDFFPNIKVKMIGALLLARIPNMNNTVYLIQRTVEVNDGGDRFFEVYITDDNNKVIGLCNTRNAHPSIVSKFNELYKAAIVSSESVYIDDNTKSIINRYKENRSKKGGQSHAD